MSRSLLVSISVHSDATDQGAIKSRGKEFKVNTLHLFSDFKKPTIGPNVVCCMWRWRNSALKLNWSDWQKVQNDLSVTFSVKEKTRSTDANWRQFNFRIQEKNHGGKQMLLRAPKTFKVEIINTTNELQDLQNAHPTSPGLKRSATREKKCDSSQSSNAKCCALCLVLCDRATDGDANTILSFKKTSENPTS